MVRSIDLPRLAENHAVAKQLLRSLDAYAGSGSFLPSGELELTHLDTLFASASEKGG